MDLRPIRGFAPQLVGGVEDWEVILGLGKRGAEALVTCDDNMLFNPRVVAVVEQLQFTVVSCRSAGDDPVLATGILLTQLPHIGKRHSADRPQIWRLSGAEQRVTPIGKHKTEVERRSGERVDDYRLARDMLQGPLTP